VKVPSLGMGNLQEMSHIGSNLITALIPTERRLASPMYDINKEGNGSCNSLQVSSRDRSIHGMPGQSVVHEAY
jgi:hypothetical protein